MDREKTEGGLTFPTYVVGKGEIGIKMESFQGYHSEWNMGSPGGWDYQRMAQELGKMAWEVIKKRTRVKIQLDFDHPILNPVPSFASMLLQAHKRRFGRKKVFIALVAEEETLDKVGENIHFIDYLNRLEGVKAKLVPPQKLEINADSITIDGERVTLVFLDFNNNVIVKLDKKYNLRGLMEAIKKGLVINPRGLEPIGAKGVFEVITGDFKGRLFETTVKRTPWTRQFYPRATTGPNDEEIPDLVKWVKENWERLILKPVHGYSGKGILIGYQRSNPDEDIQQVLKTGGYIVQELIPLKLWSEEFPWIDRERKVVFIKSWQTDFRCFISHRGLIGFVTRFGGVPTNVGSGGGVQSSAILRSSISVKEAIERINEAIVDLGYRIVAELQERIAKSSIQMGNVYLLGPIMNTLRPRIITDKQLTELKGYAQCLWQDAVKLERLWQEGRISKFVEISREEEEIARLSPWNGDIALIASDGLFNFREGGNLD